METNNRHWSVVLLGAPLLALAIGVAQAGDKKEMGEPAALGVLFQANSSEIALGQLGAARLEDPELRTYALEMAREHYTANEALLGIVAADPLLRLEGSSIQKKLGDGSRKELADLWKEDAGPELDHAFVIAAIEGHQDLLERIDETILPSLLSASVNQVFVSSRATIGAHLSDACRIGARLAVVSDDEDYLDDVMEGCEIPLPEDEEPEVEDPETPSDGTSQADPVTSDD